MFYIICFYFVVTVWVFCLRYNASDEETRSAVRERWWVYLLACIGWPLLFSRKGF